MRVSLFIDPDPRMIKAAADTGTDRVELYTESYAAGFDSDPQESIKTYIEAANTAADCRLGLNAGHDLNLKNLPFFAMMIPGLLEVSIGHAVISDALYLGLKETISRYKQCLAGNAPNKL